MKSSFNWHEEAEKQWDQRSVFWNENSKNMWENGSRKTIIPFFARHVDTGVRVLDAGCGDGYGAYKLSQSGFVVTGIDLSSAMIAKANMFADDKLDFRKSDLIKTPFPADTFDAAIAINSLEWTEKPLLAIEELNRVVKSDGLICIGLLGPTAAPRKNSFPRLHGGKAICNTMMPWELEQLAERIGWELVDGQPVYREGIVKNNQKNLPDELKQALSFMWLFMFRK